MTSATHTFFVANAAAEMSAAEASLASRRSTSAFALVEPGPDPAQLERLLTLALRVPDHGQLEPWRLIIVEGDARERFAAEIEAAYLANAAPDQQTASFAARIRRFLTTPPLLIIVVANPTDNAKIPRHEQLLSAGALCMNLLHAAHALGFAANWLTGWIAGADAARPVLGLRGEETVAGLIPVGTAASPASERPRPALARVVSLWGAGR